MYTKRKKGWYATQKVVLPKEKAWFGRAEEKLDDPEESDLHATSIEP